VWATYGTYRGVSNARVRGFSVAQGSPTICANAANYQKLGTRVADGRKGTLGVLCPVAETCSVGDGRRYGFTFALALRGPRGRVTRVFLTSARLQLAEVLAIAASLRPVSR